MRWRDTLARRCSMLLGRYGMVHSNQALQMHLVNDRDRAPPHALVVRAPTACEEDQMWDAVRTLLYFGSDVLIRDTIDELRKSLLISDQKTRWYA